MINVDVSHPKSDNHYFVTSQGDKMKKCRIRKYTGPLITSYNLEDEYGDYVMSCIVSKDFDNLYIFTTIKDSYLRTLDEVPTTSDCETYFGTMSKGNDNDFTVRSFNDIELALIRYTCIIYILCVNILTDSLLHYVMAD
jgi:hypothetical protein